MKALNITQHEYVQLEDEARNPHRYDDKAERN